MDADRFAPEESPNSPGSSSSSSYPSSPRSRGSDFEASIEKLGESREAVVGGGRVSDDDEIGEFLSGGEEFEEPAEELEQEEDSDLPFVDSSGFPAPIALPVARASVIDSDDDDDDVVGGSKLGVEGKEEEEGGSGEGLKIFGVSGLLESVGAEETQEPVVVVKSFGENGDSGEFVNGNGVGDGSERIDGVLVGDEQEKVLEIPKSGQVEASVSESSVQDEVIIGLPAGLEVEEKGEEVEEDASLGSGIDKVDTVIVEPVNEKSGEPDVIEVAGNGGSVVATEESDVLEKVKDEGKIDVLVGEESEAVLEVKENGGVVNEDTTLGSGTREVEQVTEKLGEPDGTELASKGDSVVEAINVNLLSPGAAVVGDVEETKVSEIKEKDNLIVTPVSVDNVFDRISPDAEEPEKVAELSTGKIPETTEVELNGSNEPETYASVAGKGTDQITSVVDEEKSDVLVGEKTEGVEEGTVLGNGIDKLEPLIGSVAVEPVSDKLEEPDAMGLAGKEDSVMEAINVNLLASGAAVIGDVEENKLPEKKEKSTDCESALIPLLCVHG